MLFSGLSDTHARIFNEVQSKYKRIEPKPGKPFAALKEVLEQIQNDTAMTTAEIEAVNRDRVKKLLEAIYEIHQQKQLPQVLWVVLGGLYERLKDGSLTPKEALRVLEMDGNYGALKLFLQIAQHRDTNRKNINRYLVTWTKLFDKLRKGGIEGQDYVRGIIQDWMIKDPNPMNFSEWQELIARLKQHILGTSDTQQPFLLETNEEALQRLAMEVKHVHATLQFLRNLPGRDRVRLEKKSTGLQQLFRRALRIIYRPDVAERIIEDNMWKHQFYVPVFESLNEEAIDEDWEAFLAKLALDNNLKLIIQPGDTVKGRVLGVKSLKQNSEEGAEQLYYDLRRFLRDRQNHAIQQFDEIRQVVFLEWIRTETAETQEPMLIDADVLTENGLQDWDVEKAKAIIRQAKGFSIVNDTGEGKEFTVLADKALSASKTPKALTSHLGASDKATVVDKYGGIDLNSANMNLQIKRDGKGVPLPLALQDMDQLMQVQGFIPEIIEIKPAVNLPILNELQQKLQASSV